MLARGYRFKLYPTAEQDALFRHFAGVCRLVYNVALEQRRDWWRHYERETGQRLNYVAQARQLTDLRAEFNWIRAVGTIMVLITPRGSELQLGHWQSWPLQNQQRT